MKTFNTFIAERFVNALPNDEELKRKWSDDVWSLLQKSYEKIGGIKGKGFESKQSMIDNIPMWKMAVKNGKLVAVILYKDKGGRKSVAMGAVKGDESKAIVANMFAQEIKRSYGEKSKAALGTMMKSVPWDVLEKFAMDPKSIDGAIPITKINPKEWPKDASFTIDKYPELKKYGYLRDLGGEMIFKVAFGTKGKFIK